MMAIMTMKTVKKITATRKTAIKIIIKRTINTTTTTTTT